MALKFKPEALFKGGAKAAPKKAAAKKVLVRRLIASARAGGVTVPQGQRPARWPTCPCLGFAASVHSAAPVQRNSRCVAGIAHPVGRGVTAQQD